MDSLMKIKKVEQNAPKMHTFCNRFKNFKIKTKDLRQFHLKITKLKKMQNEPKTNPNEPNFLEDKPNSKRENGDFRQIYENLFMQNEPNGMLLVFKSQWSMMYHLIEKIPNKANQSQSNPIL